MGSWTLRHGKGGLLGGLVEWATKKAGSVSLQPAPLPMSAYWSVDQPIYKGAYYHSLAHFTSLVAPLVPVGVVARALMLKKNNVLVLHGLEKEDPRRRIPRMVMILEQVVIRLQREETLLPSSHLRPPPPPPGFIPDYQCHWWDLLVRWRVDSSGPSLTMI